MAPLRTVDPDAFDRTRYDTQHLFHGESCVIIASSVPAGRSAFRRHRHEHGDQLYYVLEGEMHVLLGAEELTAGPDTLVYIPEGLPHHNWNEGEVDELHLEVIAPCPFPTLPLATPTDDPGGEAGDPTSYLVSRLDESAFEDTARFDGFRLNRGLLPNRHSEHVSPYVGEVEPGAAGPPLHIHPFDQFYFVLAGELSVQIGLEQLVATPGTLTVMPAGVPHRQWNAGPVTERHLTLLVPSPVPGQPMDVGVVFEPSGVEID
jgi:mannose-6-phosphate isomerase-like protein (cupin superfamily)